MRKCKRCDRECKNSDFMPSDRNRCRRCKLELHKEWVAKNPDRSREIYRKSAKKCRKKRKARMRQYYLANREKLLAQVKARYQITKARRRETGRKLYTKRKEAAFAAYGNKCACCGESERMFLHFDHVNNDGYEHRQKTSPGSEFYLWLERHKYPETIQILCANCNHGKRMNGGVCPHKGVLPKKIRHVGKLTTVLDVCVEWLSGLLQHGPMLGESIQRLAEKETISTTTLHRAKETLGIKIRDREWFLQ